jgi:hypothetical protein
MESLAKFQRGKPGGLDLSLGPITRGTEQASRFHRIMTVVRVVAEFVRKLSTANGASVLLSNQGRGNHFGSHAGFYKSLPIANRFSSLCRSLVIVALKIPMFLFHLLGQVLKPLQTAFFYVGTIVVLSPVFFSSRPRLGFGSVLDDSKSVLFTAFFGTHADNYSMTVGEIS